MSPKDPNDFDDLEIGPACEEDPRLASFETAEKYYEWLAEQEGKKDKKE